MAKYTIANSIEDPGPDGFGPAFAKLNSRQRRFVLALFEIGINRNHAQAARMAGYVGRDECVRVTANRLFHDPKIQAAMDDMAKTFLSSAKPMLTTQLLDLAQNASKESDRLKATLEAMNRIGMHAVSEHHVKTENASSAKEDLIQQLQDLAKRHPELPIPDKYKHLLLAAPQSYEEAEFIIVEEGYLDL